MKVLAIGSHPDDLEIGCGGTLARLASKGHRISLLVMTGGEKGGARGIRRVEQKRAASFLNASLYWGGLRDTAIPLTKQLINRVERVIRQVQPDLTFTHFAGDTHQDHRKVSQATTTATRYLRNVLYYEVPTVYEFNPSVFVDITKELSQKEKLLRFHASQVHKTNVPNLSIIESMHACAIFRGYQNRVKYAEGFVPLRLSLEFTKAVAL